MVDLRDNDLSSIEDLPSTTAVTVNQHRKTSDKDVPVRTSTVVRDIEHTESNGSTEGNGSNDCIERMESYESNLSNEIPK